MHGQHVGVALGQNRAPCLGRRGPGQVDPEQDLTLVVELSVGGVEVLGGLVLPHGPGPEPHRPATRIGGREHDPLPEPVVHPPRRGLGPLHQPHGQQLLLAEPGSAGGHQHAVPGAGRVAHAEPAQGLLVQSTSQQIVTGRHSFARLPEVPGVVARRPVQQRVEPIASFPARRRGRILRLGLQLDPEPAGQRLQSFLEIQALGLHHELERVA